MQFSLETKNVQVANNFSLSIFALLFDIFANKKPLTCIIHSTASIICNLEYNELDTEEQYTDGLPNPDVIDLELK